MRYREGVLQTVSSDASETFDFSRLESSASVGVTRVSAMASDPQLEQLLEEIVASGRSPEEVCRGCGELLPAVLEGLRQIRAVEAEVGAIFPTRSPRPGERGQSVSLANAALPDVPGYTVLGVLGHGGMGVVFKARHLKLDRIVAIKMLIAGGFAAPAELARFLREAQAIAALRHPNIVHVYDVGDLEGRPYFTMEYIEGGNLAQKLAGVPQPAQQVAAMVSTLADAVQAAHTCGIVHRDLKPANILLVSDGMPKITDFGLARRYEEGPDLTLGGTRLGTPSYMSPEQAIGREGTIGPAADIYSLGAVLYEMLTGRPPFRGDSAAETERQLLRDDPAPPRLLNGRVPRDLEVICLKCLHKTPASRYASAQALADDLRRFLSNEPISARPVSLTERAAKWVRRSPARATLTGGSILAALVLSGAVLWAVWARASRVAAVEADLAAAVQCERRADWQGASAALDRATIRLGDGGTSDLRTRLDRAKAALILVGRLDSIRMLRAGSADGVLNDARAAKEYAEAFADAGLGGPNDTPAAVANRIVEAAVSQVLVGALDDWSLASKDASQRAWLAEIIDLADRDEDASGWRRAVRDSRRSTTRESILRLAEEAPVDQQPVTSLYAFSEALVSAGIDALPFVSRAHAAHPGDFWLTTAMGNALRLRGRHADSVGYFRAAVALRPDTLASHYNLGRALGEIGQLDEAMNCFHAALKRDPGAVFPLKSLGITLSKAGRHEEALDFYLRVLRLETGDPFLHLQMSWCYAQLGRYREACESYERSLDLNSPQWRDSPGTRNFLLSRGLHDLAASLWKKQLAVTAAKQADWDGYAELCLFLGDAAEYERARAMVLDRFGGTSDPNACERLGRACLLFPPSSPEQLARASTLIDRSLASEVTKRTWAYPYFRFAKALAEYRAERYSAAAAIVEGESAGVLGPAPKLLAAMCRARMGDDRVARRCLADASIGFDWTVAKAANREAWMYHRLRREAERLVFPDFDGLVAGKSEPGDEDARRALLGACQAEERHGRSAELWTAILASRKSTPEEFAEPAARSLVLAGCGAGADAGEFTDTDRAAWRALGLTVLTARIDEFERRVRSGTAGLDAVRKAVTVWETAHEFQLVREGSVLGSLPDAERAQWAALWSRARAVAGPAEPTRP